MSRDEGRAPGAAHMQVHYGDETIRFEVRHQPERLAQRLSIHVEPDGRVLVDAPVGASRAEVLVGVNKRARWISRQRETFAAQRLHATAPDYVSGEAVLYLGRRYRLRVVVGELASPVARLRGAYVEVQVPSRDAALVRDALAAWYRQRAQEVFAQRLAALTERLRWMKAVPALRLRFMTRQWGSCSPAGRLTLNPWLVRARREAIDYVLLHELCHLRQHNHSPAFYALLTRHMPGWREVKRDLDGRAEELLRD